jgi:hypothetical protein
VDQLEELFTMSTTPETQRRFLDAVFGAAEDPGDPVRVAVTLRATSSAAWRRARSLGTRCAT